MKKISRRSFLAAAGLSVAALALTACGGSASSVASSVASSASSAAASTSAAAGELTTVEAGKLTMATNAAFPPYEMTTDAGEMCIRDRYYLDENRDYCVPKRSKDEIARYL